MFDRVLGAGTCVLETEMLKPVLDKTGAGVDKIMERVELDEEDWRGMQNKRRDMAEKPLSQIPECVP
jgi:hypothetical protein